QAELQHVERRIDMTPFCKLIAPSGIELRTAQLLGIFRGKRVGDGTVRPFQPAARGGPLRPLVTRRYTQYARRPLDHHFTYVVLGLSDERNVQAGLVGVWPRAVDHRTHPFRAQPRLAGPTAAQHQPRRPWPSAHAKGRRLLVTMGEAEEISLERKEPTEKA